MKYFSFLFSAILLLLAACRSKNNTTVSHFPVLSYIQSQVAHVDTSLYSIIKLDYKDSSDADTSYIRREDFRELSKDFLEIPDISTSSAGKRFTEEKRYDETLGRVVLAYLPKEPEKENLQRQEVLIAPSAAGDKVTSIFIDLLYQTRDSSVQKRMLWRVDQSFQVTIIRQKPGEPETISINKVIWNEPTDQ